MASSSSMGSSSGLLKDVLPIGDRLDDGLRALAAFWSYNPRRFHTELFERPQLLGGSSSNPTAGNLTSTGWALALNAHPLKSEGLYVIIGLGIAALAADIAFGFARSVRPRPDPVAEVRQAAVRELEAEALAAAAAAPAPAPADVDATEAAQEWEYFKRTKVRFLFLSCVLGFASEFLLWMLAPFFPVEGLHRGLSPEIIGLIFACHPLALLISSQFAPFFMRSVEPFVLLQRTLLMQAVFIATFGLAGSIADGVPFACCACINRLLLGLMSGLNEPCAQAVTLRIVPAHAVAFAFGLIIAARFTAMIVGPAVGSALYAAGGFPLPFLVSAALFLCLGALTMWVGATTPVSISPPKDAISLWRLLRLRGLGLMLVCIFLLWFNVMALEPLWQPQLVSPPYARQKRPRKSRLRGVARTRSTLARIARDVSQMRCPP